MSSGAEEIASDDGEAVVNGDSDSSQTSLDSLLGLYQAYGDGMESAEILECRSRQNSVTRPTGGEWMLRRRFNIISPVAGRTNSGETEDSEGDSEEEKEKKKEEEQETEEEGKSLVPMSQSETTVESTNIGRYRRDKVDRYQELADVWRLRYRKACETREERIRRPVVDRLEEACRTGVFSLAYSQIGPRPFRPLADVLTVSQTAKWCSCRHWSPTPKSVHKHTQTQAQKTQIMGLVGAGLRGGTGVRSDVDKAFISWETAGKRFS
ncbi:unnamed protein product [Protopolystoma xenopodis]|uniref:Uncharacterized protein n=1 Tax=Protopolystoma xenopodis TaxID=117903 RepID=A0A3S5BIE6_9PLAT|nr:unnamed protein product [Protopolystoma xenopodis]